LSKNLTNIKKFVYNFIWVAYAICSKLTLDIYIIMKLIYFYILLTVFGQFFLSTNSVDNPVYMY